MMTIKPNKYSLILISVFLFSNGTLFGQRKDFLTWFGADLNKDLKNGMNLSAEFQQRFKNNSLSYDRTMFTLVTDYDFTDYFGASLGVRTLVAANDELNLQTKYRLHADLAGSYPARDIDLSFRTRIQYGFGDPDGIGSIGSNSLVNRYRIKAGYHIFGTRLGIFASLEGMLMLSGNPARRFYKMRYQAGAEYTLTFKSEFTLRYIMEDEFNVADPLLSHILSFGYSYSL